MKGAGRLAVNNEVNVLILEDSKLAAMRLQCLLESVAHASYSVRVCHQPEDALAEVCAGWPSICLVDYYLQGDTAEGFLQQLQGYDNAPPVVVLTAAEDVAIDQQVMRAGAMDFLLKHELSSAALERSIRYVTHHAERQRQLRASAERDALTGIYNRAGLRRLLDSFVRQAKTQIPEFAIAYIDFDGFKKVNDSFGHAVGDRLLAAAAKRIDGCVERLALPGLVARAGGDEFVVVLKAVSSEAAQQLVENVFDALAKPFLLNDEAYGLSVSVGLAASTDSDHDPESIMRKADTAMYGAKRAGRKQWCWYLANDDVEVERQPYAESRHLYRDPHQQELNVRSSNRQRSA